MSKKILAIDDNKEFLDTLKTGLEESGYEVQTLSDPTLTEEYIEKYCPDILIIDVFMPERSGFNILEDFREKKIYPDLPKVFITCLDDDVEKIVAKGCGVDYYITKPFDFSALLELLHSILNG